MSDRSDDISGRSESSGKLFPAMKSNHHPDTHSSGTPSTRRNRARGVGVFSGYHNDATKTEESFDSEGWFFSGDLGSIDEHGRVAFLGRLKDMLKVGGENVASVEIEGYLATHPKIKLSAVVGLEDEKYGEVPVAFVELSR